MNRRGFVRTGAMLVGTGLTLTGSLGAASNAMAEESNESKRHAIDVKVQETMSKLFSTVKGSKELVNKSTGILVFPSVLKVGFVAGGQYGEGALRVNGKSVGYYETVSASFGLQAGAQSKAVIFLFMTHDALESFRHSNGWSIGKERSVALLTVGANGSLDSSMSNGDINAIAMTNGGLMGDLSFAGTRVTRLKI